GAMLAVVVLTDNNRYSITEQAVTTGLMVLVILAALLLMLGAGFINRLIGRSGASILSRVMGLILAAVAVDNVRQALMPSLPT
ncbi:MAG: MarC family protein, partial [Kiloniellales bacterium]|nr:MarC family protein [Kiloniellales bacterium]